MGEIVGAALVAHVPTMVLPEEERRALNQGQEISLVPGLHRLRSEVLDPLDADTFVVLDSHWFTTVECVVGSHPHRQGRFTSDELPRGMSQVPYDFPGDPALARAMAEAAETTDNCWITPIDDPCLPLHYATVNLLGFLQGRESWLPVSVVQTGRTDDFLTIGRAIGEAVAASDRRVVLLASGAMSHTFWSLKELRSHEASDPVHIRTAEAREADQRIIEAWGRGDHRAVLAGMEGFLQFRPEARFGHYLMMLGALGGDACVARGRPFSDYENSIGTAQIHIWFDRPEGGWTR